MKKTRVKKLQGNKWQMEGKLVLKEGKVYILKNEELRAEVIWWQDMKESGKQWNWSLEIIGGQR